MSASPEGIVYLDSNSEVKAVSSNKDSFNHLAELIANLTEAYTAAIFLKNPKKDFLTVAGVQTLSRDFLDSAEIPFGNGLIGWTAQNGARVSVSPFEHNATTLLCYGRDQGLKSFVAVPILNENGEVLGVIACDSKKSYAFAKVTEKILLDCAKQVSILCKLHSQLAKAVKIKAVDQDLLTSVTNSLLDHKDEHELLSAAANLPDELIKRDALVVVTAGDACIGEGTFYSSSSQKRMNHRLLQLVCQHKKVICGDRSVLALPTDDVMQRSFLSIPFHVLGKEVGSFNLLSHPSQGFEASEIATVEKVASVVGRELERIRLRDQVSFHSEASGLSSWKRFSLHAETMLAETQKKRGSLTLIRIALTNIIAIEDVAGVPVAATLLEKVMRLVEQVKHHYSIACYLYGFQILILSETTEAQRTINRLLRLIEKISFGDQFISPGLKLHDILLRDLHICQARYPQDGHSIQELVGKTLRQLEISVQEKEMEVEANVRNWA
jgi:GAF domain-containing protein